MKKVLVTTASLGDVPLTSYWTKQISKKYQIDYRRYTNLNFPDRRNSMSPRLNAKIARMLSHELCPGYDYYIWMDRTFCLFKPDAIEKVVDFCANTDLCLFKHPLNNTIQEELKEVHAYMDTGNQYLIRRYQGERMDEQVAYYLSDPDYKDDLLFATGAFIYKKELVRNHCNVMKEWFFQNVFWSVEDQLSLPPIIKKLKPNYKLFHTDIYHNPWLEFQTRLVSIV
jgi:hypothetical protein